MNSIPLAVAQFALTGFLAVALFGFIGVQVLRHSGTSEATRNAKELTRLAGEGIVAPNVTPGVLNGSPRALQQLDGIVRDRVLRAPVVRVKIWDAQSRILYSDERRLIGTRFPLGEGELAALRLGGTETQVSDLSQPENRFESGRRKLLEVYHGIRDPRGRPLLFEAYLSFSSVAASGQRLWESFAPALIGGLLLLELAQVPLAYSLAKRLRRGQEERETLLKRAIDASEIERRRIARDLHDGVVQNLAGVSYSLAAASRLLNANGTPRFAGETIERAAHETRRSIRELRSMLVDLYPPDLQRAGLPAALGDLVSQFTGLGVAAKLEIDPKLSLAADTEACLFRAAQEALRNVSKHADAEVVRVSVARENGTVTLVVNDDGRGYEESPESAADTRHFGLRMLADLARGAGGQVTVDSVPGGGTTVRMELPVA